MVNTEQRMRKEKNWIGAKDVCLSEFPSLVCVWVLVRISLTRC